MSGEIVETSGDRGRIIMRIRIVFFVVLFFAATGFILTLPAFSQNKKDQASYPVEGIYSNLQFCSETGDVEGMRVIILRSGANNYHVVAQLASGGMPEPVLVKADRKGNKITFTIPVELPGFPMETFSGTVFSNGLSLKSKNYKMVLKRLKCNIDQ